jgi:hypothetical protein
VDSVYLALGVLVKELTRMYPILWLVMILFP